MDPPDIHKPTEWLQIASLADWSNWVSLPVSFMCDAFETDAKRGLNVSAVRQLVHMFSGLIFLKGKLSVKICRAMVDTFWGDMTDGEKPPWEEPCEGASLGSVQPHSSESHKA